jgi:rubrerythrin
VTTYQAHARRREKAAIKAAMREVDPEEFGECRLCGFTHSYPLERTVCPVCGGLVCCGEQVCACGDGGGMR